MQRFETKKNEKKVLESVTYYWLTNSIYICAHKDLHINVMFVLNP